MSAPLPPHRLASGSGTRRALSALAAVATIALVASCSSGDPLASDTNSSPSDTVVVGSAGFAESEIIAELYAQALEAQGVKVDKRLSIGQRDVYLAALADGSIDVIPEYSGNLLQHFAPTSTARTSDEVFAALGEAVPSGFKVLDQAPAQDQDTYAVTAAFSQENSVKSLADLAGKTITVAGNPELAQRPYGIPGLTSIYGVAEATLLPISDSGGPLTVNALKDGSAQLANLFSTSPALADDGLVTLTDPESMILPQHVVPLVNSAKASPQVIETLNKVSAELTTQELIELNVRNQGDEKASPAKVARDWLVKKSLIS